MSTLPIQTPNPSLDSSELQDRVARFQKVHEQIVTQVHRVIVGQEEVIDQVMVALFVGGHCLITGLPGTAKTLLVRTLAQILGLDFKRIQFTPDLMPSDITGTDIIEEDPGTGRRTWTFVAGPIFANILLADEINRTPPKTQSALLEAMQELSCTVRGNQYKIAPPFFVLATQNPIELEGTYPLPEAQLDRFIFNVLLDYLTAEDEMKVLDLTTTTPSVEGRRGDHAGRDSQFPAVGAHGADRRFGGPLRGDAGASHARDRRVISGLCQEVRELRGQRPRGAEPGAVSQGARADASPVSRVL